MKDVRIQTIETPRLILRLFREEDAPKMFANWASDEVVTKFLTWPTHESVETTRQIIAQWAGSGSCDWCIEPKAEGEPMGSIGVVHVDPQSETVEVGYCLARKCWGKGYVPEALRALIDWLFREMQPRRITAKHDLDNPNSGKVMRKAGMTFLENRSAAVVNHLGLRDVAVYAIDRPEEPSL